MKLLDRTRAKASPQPARPRLGGDISSAPPSAAGEADDAPRVQERWSHGSHLLTRAMSFALMAALVSGPVALGLSAFKNDAPVVAQGKAEVTHDSIARRSVASEQAAAWVQAWLTTPAARAAELKTWWPGPIDLPKVAGQAADVRVVDAIPTAPGVWAVTIAANVTPAKDEPITRRYYMVPVQVDGGTGDASASVKAIPAIVQAPATAKTPSSPYNVNIPSASPVVASAQAFMSAYLAGDGDVARYTTPGSPLHAVSETPLYEEAEVVSVRASERVDNVGSGQTPADGQVVQALVDVTLVDPGPGEASTRKRSASWPLTLTARDGRWEITAVDGTFQTTAENSSAASSTTSPKE